MATFEQFLPEILLDVPAVPEMVAVNAVRNSAIEFCQRSQIWHYEVANFNSVAEQADYVAGTDFTLPASSILAQLNFVYYEKNKLIGTNQDRLDNFSYNWRSRESSIPTRVYMIDSTTVRFVDTPKEVTTDGIDMGVFLKPDRTSTTIADDIYDQYLEEIAVGAKYRLLGMRGKSWYDPVESLRHRHKNISDIGKARIRSSKSYGRGGKIVNLRPFGGTFDGT